MRVMDWVGRVSRAREFWQAGGLAYRGIDRHRVVAWASGSGCGPCVGVTKPYRSVVEIDRWYMFDPAKVDLSVHECFCRGDVPGYVYADWVEEHLGAEFADIGYRILRCRDVTREEW